MRFLNWHTDQFVLDNLPVKRLTVRNIKWINALISPLATMYAAFKIYYMDVNEQLRYNSQTIVMEGLLNDYFDPVFRRIYIVTASERDIVYSTYYDAENGPEYYLYYQAEGKPQLYSYYSTEALGAADFYVNLPAGLVYDDLAMRAKLNKYKLATKRYIIQ